MEIPAPNELPSRYPDCLALSLQTTEIHVKQLQQTMRKEIAEMKEEYTADIAALKDLILAQNTSMKAEYEARIDVLKAELFEEKRRMQEEFAKEVALVKSKPNKTCEDQHDIKKQYLQIMVDDAEMQAKKTKLICSLFNDF